MPKSSRKRSCTAHRDQAVSAPPRYSAINDCPAEIWGRICSEACTDDGSTGRSLSLVSKYIRDTSRPYKYQCLYVEQHQFRLLAAILRKLPPEFRRIQHLFLSSHNWSNLWSYNEEHAEFFSTDKNYLLIMASSTLKTLVVRSHSAGLHLAFQMPVLQDLTLYGDTYHRIPSRPTLCYPQLRRLHLACYTGIQGGKLLSMIKGMAPRTTELRVSLSGATSFEESPQAEFVSALEKRHAVHQRTATSLHMEKILVQPSRYHLAEQFRKIKDGRFVLLKPQATYVQQGLKDISKMLWTAHQAGGRDYWNPADDEIDTWTDD